MADTEQLYTALRNAHAAGDVAAAQKIASYIQSQQPKAEQRSITPESADIAAADTGVLENIAIAAGRGFDKAAMGLKDLALAGVEKFAPQSFAEAAIKERQALAADEAEKDAAYAGLQRRRPIVTAASEATPSVAATMTLGPGYLVPAVGTAVVEGLKYGTPQERMSRALLGAGSSLVGTAVGNTLGKFISPVGNKATGETQREALKAAQDIGYKPRLSEVTGSPYLARLEDMAARTPGGAGIMDDFARANQEAVNRSAASSIGQVADELSPTVLKAAREEITKPFNQVRDLPGKAIQISPNVGAVADDVLRQSRKMIESERDPALIKLAEQAKALASNNGKIDGEAYNLIRSGLSNQSFEASGTAKTLYGKLLKALDDSADESLRASGNAVLADALKTSRPQYGNLMTLEKGLVAEGGNVSPARLAQALRGQNSKLIREGSEAPLARIGLIAENLKPLKAGSPTYERDVASSLLTTLAKAPIAYGAAKATTSPFVTALPRYLATHPEALAISQSAAQLPKPAARALAQALMERALPLTAIPVVAEQ